MPPQQTQDAHIEFITNTPLFWRGAIMFVNRPWVIQFSYRIFMPHSFIVWRHNMYSNAPRHNGVACSPNRNSIATGSTVTPSPYRVFSNYIFHQDSWMRCCKLQSSQICNKKCFSNSPNESYLNSVYTQYVFDHTGSHVWQILLSCKFFLLLTWLVVHRNSATLVESTVKPVCNDHLYNKIYYLWFIQ